MHAFKRPTVKFIIVSALLGLVGCADYNWRMPGVYRIPVQQGVVIEQDAISQLKPGMDKDQVRFIMGSPVIVDPFHSNRWDYLYTLQSGSDKVREQRRITLHFNEDEQLAYVDGDIVIGNPDLRAEETQAADEQPESYVVPERSKPGFFGRMIGAGDSSESSETDKRSQENIEVIEQSGEAGTDDL